MADEATVTIRGFDGLASGTRKLAGNIEQAAGRSFEGVAAEIAQTVRGTVPHVSGALAGTVESFPADKGAGVGYSGGVPYDGWIEFGGNRGRPYVGEGRYLYPAATDAGPRLDEAGRKLADSEIGGMAWPSPT